jgi:hypothetical protein
MPRKTSGSRTTRPEEPAAQPDSSSVRSVAAVVPTGNRRESLEAIRDRLAAETDDTTWTKHKEECSCVCGMGDGRLLVALAKELRAVMEEIASLAEPEGASKLDGIVASVAGIDDLRRRRATRVAGAAGP